MPRPEWALVRLYKFENGSFPWGLWSKVITILEKNQEANGDTWTCEFTHTPMNHIIALPSYLRQYQVEAIGSLIRNHGGVLCMPTGSGKTITLLEFLKAVGREATVVVHTRDLKNQWEEEAEKLGVKIKVITYQSPIAAEYLKLASVVVFDECHHVAAKTVYALAGKCREDQIRIGLSATPWREDGCDLLIEAALGPVIYKVDRLELIKEGFLVNAKVYYLQANFKDLGYLDYQETYEYHVVKNEDRNKVIVSAAHLLAIKGLRVLVLVNHIEHGDWLLDHFTQTYPDDRVVFIHGTSKDRAKGFGEAQVIIASQVFNEGVDFPELDALVLAGGGKSSIRVTQQVGRVLRQRKGKSDAVVVDFIDTPKHLAKHYKLRRALLEEEFEVSEGWPMTVNPSSGIM